MTRFFDIFSQTRPLAACLLLVSLAVLAAAYISQYVFHYDPCVLCLYQRKPWWGVIVLSLIVLAACKSRPLLSRRILWLSVATFLTGAGIAFYHLGVEQQWWAGTQACSDTGLPAASDIEALKAYLTNRNIVRCDVPTWKLFGLSMTTYNLMASLFMSVFTLAMLLRRNSLRL